MFDCHVKSGLSSRSSSALLSDLRDGGGGGDTTVVILGPKLDLTVVLFLIR